jgi:hypothetical protein
MFFLCKELTELNISSHTRVLKCSTQHIRVLFKSAWPLILTGYLKRKFYGPTDEATGMTDVENLFL